MFRETLGSLFLVVLLATASGAKTLTYNLHEEVSLRDQGFAADERETNALVSAGNLVYGATSGDRCHVFRFDPNEGAVEIFATIPGPNTVMKGLVAVGDVLYVGTMQSDRQLLLRVRETQPDFDPQEVHLLPIEASYQTGHLYRVSGMDGESPKLEDLGVPVTGQGIHTLAADASRGLIYGVTSPNGRFFVYDVKTGKTEQAAFGRTYTNVSNHMVAAVTVDRELADLTPGEGEWNNRLIPKAMHVRADGTMYTSGWNGRILKYDPEIARLESRFSEVAWIPSVPGRQLWNRIDAIVAREDKLYLGTSDGYILRLDPSTNELENLGKPIRAIDVMGMVFSPLDGKLYGVSGGELEGMSRLWSCDVEKGTFEVDHPVFQVVPNRRSIGGVVCTGEGTLVLSEAFRVANVHVLKAGEAKPWEKSGVLDALNPQEARPTSETEGRFEGRKMLEVEVFPMPSSMHGGSGYTAIQADREGRVYVGTAYYGKNAQLTQLDPRTATWRSIFRSDELTHQYGRGQGIPGKIHTKLRLGADAKIYGAMKQGYELHYATRADIGEAPEGVRGSQFTCHFFSYDPATDITTDLGPGWPQEGITAFDVDTDRGYLYGGSVPGVFFLAYDLKRGRVWNAGQIRFTHPTRYMPLDPGTGRVYHPGEVTPTGTSYMTVWDPVDFRLRDVEVVPEEGFMYSHSYATTCGVAGSNVLYGHADNSLFEMDLDESKDGRLHVRRLCYIGVEGDEKNSGMYAIERGFDGRIYWASTGGRNVPVDLFVWDPATREKSYLGSCATGGEWIKGGQVQGMCLDEEGNLALHMLYTEISKEQQKHWRTSEGFFYEDITPQSHFLGYPSHLQGTYYGVYYVKVR